MYVLSGIDSGKQVKLSAHWKIVKRVHNNFVKVNITRRFISDRDIAPKTCDHPKIIYRLLITILRAHLPTVLLNYVQLDTELTSRISS